MKTKMVIALIALFVALTGSAAAVTVAYAKNSDKVDGKHAVASSVSIFKPAGKLVATSGASGRLPSNIIPATNYTIVTGPTTTMCASGGGSCQVGSSQAFCPSGRVAVGGGWNGEDSPPVDATVGYSHGSGPGWVVIMVNNSVLAATYHAVAVCAPGTSSGSAARMSARADRQAGALRRRLER